MKEYIIRLLFKVDASGLKKQLQSISKEAAKVGAAMAKSMNRAFKTVAKEGGNASKQVVKSLDDIEKKTKTTNKRVKEIGSSFAQTAQVVAQAFAGVQVFRGISSSIDQFAKLESSLEKLKSATQIFGKDFSRIRTDLLAIRQDGVLSFETLAYTARQLLSPNINMASESVGEFVNALKTVAVVEGIYEDIDFAIQSFVRGLQTGTPELLENLSSDLRAFIQTEAGGFAKVQQDQAARQMVFNEILRKGTEQQEEYNRLLGTTASTFKILANDSKRVSESLGEAFAPVLKEIAEAFSGILEDIEIFLEKMTATEKAALVVGVAMGGLALIISGPLVLAVRGLIAAFIKLNVVSGGVLIAIGTAVTGLAYIISKSIAESRETFGGLAEELDKTKKRVKELKDELARNPNDKDIQEDIKDFLEKQLDLEEKILEKTRERVIAVGQVKSAVKSLGRAGAMNIAQRVSEEAFVARVEALKIIQGTKLGTGVEQFIGAGRGEKGIAKLIEEGFTKAQANIIREVVQGIYQPTFPAKGRTVSSLSPEDRRIYDAQQALAPGVPMREFQKAFAKSEQQYRNVTNLIQQAFSGLSQVLRGGGTDDGPRGGIGGMSSGLGRGLSLTFESRGVEGQRQLNETLASIEEFATSDGIKNLETQLAGTGVTAEEYLETLKEEAKIRYQISRLDDLSSVFDGITSSLAKLKNGGVDAVKGLGSLTKSIGELLPEKIGLQFGVAGSAIGLVGSLGGLFNEILSGGAEERLLKEQEKHRAILEQSENHLKTLASISLERQKSERETVDREIDSATRQAERDKVLLEGQFKGEELRKEQLKVDQQLNNEIAEILRLRGEKIGLSFGDDGAALTTRQDVSMSIANQQEIARIGRQFAQEMASIDVSFGSNPAFFSGVREDVIKRVRSQISSLLTEEQKSSLEFLTGVQGSETGLRNFFDIFEADFEKQEVTFNEQLDILNQLFDLETSNFEIQNDLLREVAENTSNLQKIQPRGFGAVDVSRGGLAFGRDFIPTAASLISNVGVPAQIGNLSVAAEANKTMDQKILDSLQNQLNELKVQTNLLAQLTNTDARIVIANAQQAVKATGF